MKGGGPFSLGALFGFHGRIGRRQFALSMAYQAALTLTVAAIPVVMAGARFAQSIADGMAGDLTTLDIQGLVGPIAFIVIAQTALSVLTFTSMRARLHDIGMSAWWTIPMCLPSLVAFGGTLLYTGVNADMLQAIGIYVTVLFVGLLAILPGTRGDNSYGPPPLRGSGAS
jgi:uncharacterized membrane protein YhaH (DUF805 family)